MKSVLSLIAAITFLATSGPASKILYHQVRVESLKKVDQGLGSLSDFTKRLNNRQNWFKDELPTNYQRVGSKKLASTYNNKYLNPLHRVSIGILFIFIYPFYWSKKSKALHYPITIKAGILPAFMSIYLSSI